MKKKIKRLGIILGMEYLLILSHFLFFRFVITSCLFSGIFTGDFWKETFFLHFDNLEIDMV